jgi:ribonuclease HI
MAFLMDCDLPPDSILRMNRCRNFLNALHLSDIATADGNYIDQRFLLTTTPRPLDSTLSFPREHPTKADWLMWRTTWKSLTSPAYRLRANLGPWIHQSTVQWRWFHDASSDCILQATGDITHVYSCQSTSFTRSGSRYSYLHSTRTPASGVPISIAMTPGPTDELTLNIVSRSPNTLIVPTNKSTTFWDTLLSGGGAWMWQKFHFTDKSDTSIDWIVQGLLDGTLLWVTDGSHFSQRGPYVSGAAWVVTDRNTEATLACSFAELSPAASSYRAEALGLYSIHAFIHALSTHYQLQTGAAEICCDNKAALDESQRRKKRIGTSAACADVFRGIRSMTSSLPTIHWTYTWVRSHMDDILVWQELTRAQQLNVMCDTLAKRAAEEAIATATFDVLALPTQLLPHENIAVFVSSVKQTSDPAMQIRFSCGKHAARNFLTSEMGWSSKQFDEVDWENLHLCLLSKPDGFRTWLSKQHSNFCATRVQTQRWFGSDDNKCPSCLAIEERAEHLCRCQDPARRELLATNTEELIHWMSIGDNTHPDIIRWVESYILSQGRLQLRLEHHPHSIRDLVASQTQIGWRNFMEGRISTHFHRLQFCHLIHARTNMTASSWVRTFISKLLHITHSQWIFRNFMLHEKTHGLLRLHERQAILLQVEALSLSEKNDLPEDSQFLLEFDIARLQQADYETQCYWVAAVVAARTAIYGPDQPTNTPTPQPLLRQRQQIQMLGQPLRWSRAPVEIQPTRSRPSPSARFALEASNIARKPD